MTTLVSMLCTPSSTNCDCHQSISTENASSWAWQEFGIFAAASPPAKRRRHLPPPIPDGTCHVTRLHEDDNGATISQPSPAKRTKESQDNNSVCQMSRSVSSTVSLSEEESKDSSKSIVIQRGGISPACARGGDGTDGQPMQNRQANKISINEQISSFLREEAHSIRLEEECVRPHPLTNDVLSHISSTPFDHDEMRSCYKQNKKSSVATIDNTASPLPVIPQKTFIEGMPLRKLTADITTFLLDEAAKIAPEEQEVASSQVLAVDSSNNDSTSKYDIHLKDSAAPMFGKMHDDTVTFLGYKQREGARNQRMKEGDVIVAINGTDVTDLSGNAVQNLLRVVDIEHLTFVDRNWYDSQNAPKTLADAEKNYENAFKLSRELQQSHYNISRSITQRTSYDGELDECFRESKYHFRVAEKLRATAWQQKQLVLTSIRDFEAKKAEVIPTATASDVVKLSHVDVSKLPVGFAFRLGDARSENLAKASATRWRVEGKKASNSIVAGSRITPESTGKRKTPESKGTPESSQSAAKSTHHRSPAILLATESMEPKYPGWTKKTFQRASGSTAGTKDKYFYSPHQQIKFRSLKGVDTFTLILKEPEVNGDETKALVVYKQRGYKL